MVENYCYNISVLHGYLVIIQRLSDIGGGPAASLPDPQPASPCLPPPLACYLPLPPSIRHWFDFNSEIIYYSFNFYVNVLSIIYFSLHITVQDATQNLRDIFVVCVNTWQALMIILTIVKSVVFAGEIPE
jgi:hypothetical protein